MREYKYRKHSSRDFGFVEFEGKRIRFPGKHDSPESRAAYFDWHAKMERQGKAARPLNAKPGHDILIGSLCLLYMDHATSYYGSSGLESEVAKMRVVVGHLIDFAGNIPAKDFGPKKLRDFQRFLVELNCKAPRHRKSDTVAAKTKRLSRTYVNSTTHHTRRIFRWAVSEEYLPPAHAHALSTVPTLNPGQWGVRETAKRKPVNIRDFVAVLKHVTPLIADMLRVQWFTGVRSDTLCEARGDQFERRGNTWKWRAKHKTQNKGVVLAIPIGPRCRKILEPYLDACSDGYLFSPRTQRDNRRYNKHYVTGTYRQAVVRGVSRAIDDKGETRKFAPWTPHQLRHSKGHIVEDLFGTEAAQAHLAHASLNATKIYTGKQRKLAATVAEAIG